MGTIRPPSPQCGGGIHVLGAAAVETGLVAGASATMAVVVALVLKYSRRQQAGSPHEMSMGVT